MFSNMFFIGSRVREKTTVRSNTIFHNRKSPTEFQTVILCLWVCLFVCECLCVFLWRCLCVCGWLPWCNCFFGSLCGCFFISMGVSLILCESVMVFVILWSVWETKLLGEGAWIVCHVCLGAYIGLRLCVCVGKAEPGCQFGKYALFL